MNSQPSITLKHLLIDNRKCIGLKYNTNKVLQALVDSLPDVSWSKTFGMFYISNNKTDLELVFKTFRGVA